MTAITALMMLLATLALCLTAAGAKHLGDEKTIDSPLPANASDQSAVAAPNNQGNSVKLAECLDPQDLICKQTTSNSTTSGAQTSVAEKRTSNTTRQLSQTLILSQSLSMFLAQCQRYFTLMQPILAAAKAFPSFLTPVQVKVLNDISTTGQSFVITSMQAAIATLATNPVLSPVQVLQVKTALEQGSTLHSNILLVIDLSAAPLNLSSAQIQTIRDMSVQNVAYYATMLEIFSDPNNQPSPSAAQTLALQNALDAATSLVTSPGKAFIDVKLRTSTLKLTVKGSRQPFLAQFLEDADAHSQLAESLLVPIVAAANPQSLTLSEASQLEAVLTSMQNLRDVTTPNLIDMLETNPTLTPTQVQQVENVIASRVTMLTAIESLVGKISQKLNMDAKQVKAITDVTGVAVNMYGAVLPFVNEPNVQPTFTAAEKERLQNMLTHAQEVLAAADCSLSPTETHPPATPARPRPTHHLPSHPRPAPSGGNHHNHQHHHFGPSSFEKYMASARIRGITEELQTLLRLLNEPSFEMGKRSASQAVAAIERLLPLRTRQAEIVARLRTMSAQQQEEMDSELEVAQVQLRKLVTNEAELQQYLSKTDESQPPLSTFMKKIELTLEPFL